MIYDHTNQIYQAKWKLSGDDRYNGAYYYSKEIVDIIIPLIKTKRPWVTVNSAPMCEDGAIVFIHNNMHPEMYDWLEAYDDLVLVCGVEDTCKKVEHLGKTIYLPLSVDVEDVKSHAVKKRTGKVAFVGRKMKTTFKLPDGIDMLVGMPRELLLDEVAKYEQVFAVGRCAIEAKILGCEILPYDDRYPDPEVWQILDSKDAAKKLQKELDKIDKPKKIKTVDEFVEYFDGTETALSE